MQRGKNSTRLTRNSSIYRNSRYRRCRKRRFYLEKEKQALADAENDMADACGRLEKICGQQQELLEAFHGALPEP